MLYYEKMGVLKYLPIIFSLLPSQKKFIFTVISFMTVIQSFLEFASAYAVALLCSVIIMPSNASEITVKIHNYLQYIPADLKYINLVYILSRSYSQIWCLEPSRRPS